MEGSSWRVVKVSALQHARQPSVIQGLRRRDFLKVCGATASLLGIGATAVPHIAEALEKAVARRPSAVWLNFASDTGCTRL